MAFLDADDVWSPDKLEEQLRIADDGVIAVHTDLYSFGKVNSVDSARDSDNRLQIDASERYKPQYLAMSRGFVTPSALMVLRSVSPRYPTWARYGEDLLYFIEVAQRGHVAHVAKPLTGRRVHSRNQSDHPRATVEWHRTMEKWLSLNPVFTSCVNEVRNYWLREIALHAQSLKRERKWEDYWFVRDYLEAFRGHPSVDAVLADRVYPSWVYAVFYPRLVRSMMIRVARLFQ